MVCSILLPSTPFGCVGLTAMICFCGRSLIYYSMQLVKPHVNMELHTDDHVPVGHMVRLFRQLRFIAVETESERPNVVYGGLPTQLPVAKRLKCWKFVSAATGYHSWYPDFHEM